ncbi:MAG: hypothetical protein ACI9HK_005420, partial [Pirellulaceae bacterium]
PWSWLDADLVEGPKELIWITGISVKMVDADGTTAVSPQFMCHANLDLDPVQHMNLFGNKKQLDGRVFTLSQGQTDVQLPPGYGIPVWSDENLRLATQALNLNWPNEKFKVRHKLTVSFIRDSDTDYPMKPLYQKGIFAMVSLGAEGTVFDHEAEQQAKSELLHDMPICLPGEKAIQNDESRDRYGRKFTGHWVIPPGRHEFRTRVTTLLRLPNDTTIHYIGAHLHPTAESLSLRDITAAEVVFTSMAKNVEGGLGLEKVGFLRSSEGVPIYKDHEYELIAIYDNDTGENQDSMAVFFLYLLDQDYWDIRRQTQHDRQQTVIESSPNNGLPILPPLGLPKAG